MPVRSGQQIPVFQFLSLESAGHLVFNDRLHAGFDVVQAVGKVELQRIIILKNLPFCERSRLTTVQLPSTYLITIDIVFVVRFTALAPSAFHIRQQDKRLHATDHRVAPVGDVPIFQRFAGISVGRRGSYTGFCDCAIDTIVTGIIGRCFDFCRRWRFFALRCV